MSSRSAGHGRSSPVRAQGDVGDAGRQENGEGGVGGGEKHEVGC